MNSIVSLIEPLNQSEISLARAGGKGKSLARLASAGFPVPSGFILVTDAYKEFVNANELQSRILELVDQVDSGMLTPDEVAAKIQSLFTKSEMPEELATTIKLAYSNLNSIEKAVAVRSSATVEDLPELSFAGQQDTYLNVKGETAVLEAIRNCWASLWSSRAISYRNKNKIDHTDIAMAVIIQSMVQADVAGILFTANPTNGNRSEVFINASFGLGEAVVAGQVTPDSYILNRNDFKTKQSVIGAKEKMIVSLPEQGTKLQSVDEELRIKSSLTDELLANLAALGLEAEQLFGGVPQDIEWAVADRECHLLQSRPITNLPALALADVQWNPPAEGMRLVRRQVVENMPEPLSPLFEELYLNIGLDQSMDGFLKRLNLPANLDDFVERPLFRTVNGYAYCIASYKFGWRMIGKVPRIIYWYLTNMSKMLRNFVPEWRDEGLPTYLETVKHWQALDVSAAADEELFSGVRHLTTADTAYWFHTSLVMGIAKVTDGLLHLFLTSRLVRGQLTSGMFLRGFASKTLEAQTDLESIATRVNEVEQLRKLVIETPAEEFLHGLKNHTNGDLLLPYGDLLHTNGDLLLKELEQYLSRYGHQVYNLDFVEPTQAENPLPVILGLKALVKNSEYNTSLLQSEMARDRETLVAETLQSLGPVRRWLFRKFLRWAQFYGPNREEALFYIGAAWPTLRKLALEMGDRLVNAGTINRPDDVFFLKANELTEANKARNENKALPHLGQLANSRRELREARQHLHPPAMVPEKSKFKFGPFDLSAWETQKRNANDSDTLTGFAVSPGTVTGTASVILSPSDFENMEPNTILVCATTTPAWTPLFAQARGLVTDIGGMLAHGSIVAREYGIPAVMGTGNITQRIVSGQKISVNGNDGTVTILD